MFVLSLGAGGQADRLHLCFHGLSQSPWGSGSHSKYTPFLVTIPGWAGLDVPFFLWLSVGLIDTAEPIESRLASSSSLSMGRCKLAAEAPW